MPPPPPAKVSLAEAPDDPFVCPTVLPLPVKLTALPSSSQQSTAGTPLSMSPARRRFNEFTGVAGASGSSSTPEPACPLTALEALLLSQKAASKSISSLLSAGQRRKNRVVYRNVQEWRASRHMEDVVRRITTSLRDATWRWKYVQTFVLRVDCVSTYHPPARNGYEALRVKSRLPPKMPTVPSAESLTNVPPEAVFRHLVEFQRGVGQYLRTEWVPDETVELTRAQKQVRDQSLRRVCHLLGVPPEHLIHSRLGQQLLRASEGEAMCMVDELLLRRERATCASLIGPQFYVPTDDRETLDGAERLRRVARYGMQVREGLYSRLSPYEVDVMIEEALETLTPREKDKSALLDHRPLDDVVASLPEETEFGEVASSSTRHGVHSRGVGVWGGRAGRVGGLSPNRRWSSPAMHSSPNEGYDHMTSFRDASESKLTLDFSFSHIQSFYQLLIAPQRIALQEAAEPSLTETLQMSGGGHRRTSRHHSFRAIRRASVLHDRGGHHLTDEELDEKMVEMYRRQNVFCEKDDNPVAIRERVSELRRHGYTTGAGGGGAIPGLNRSGSLRRRSLQQRQSSSGHLRAASLHAKAENTGGLGTDVAGSGGGASTSLGDLSLQAQVLVARRGVPADELAYLDHPHLEPFLAIADKRLIAKRSRFPTEAKFRLLLLHHNELGRDGPTSSRFASPGGVQNAPLSPPAHRALAPTDARRGTRYDPDLVLWKYLQTCPSDSSSLSSATTGDPSGLAHAALFLRCLTPNVDFIEHLDLSHNHLTVVPLELVEELPSLAHLRLHGNRLASLRTVAVAAGVCDPCVSRQSTAWMSVSSAARPNSSASVSLAAGTHNDVTTADQPTSPEREHNTTPRSWAVPLSHRKDPRLGSTLRRHLVTLTLHGNPIAEVDAVWYRQCLLMCFPFLRSLDFSAVLPSEFHEVNRMMVCGNSLVIR